MTQQTSDPAVTVPTRRVDFDTTLGDLPKHFARHENLVVSHLTAVMSATFPDGEDFFVRAVRRYRDQVTDPVLKRQVAGFIGQETVHGREHRDLNDRLQALGYPTKRLERINKWSIELQEKLTSPMSCLASTAALEHVTATLAESILSNPDSREMFGPVISDLFLWHALEESEHKAVAFDVFRAAGGTEKERVRAMRQTRIPLLVSMAVMVSLSLARDRATWRRGVLRRSWREFRASPWMQREMWDRLKDYDRPGFHPTDRDTTALVEEWRTRLFGVDGTLRHLVATAA